MKLVLKGRTSTVVEEGSAFFYVNGDIRAWPEGRELHYLDVALIVTPDEKAIITKHQWDKMPLCKGGLRGVSGTVNFDVEDLVVEDYDFLEFDIGIRKFVFDNIDNLAIVESQIEKNVNDLKQKIWEATGIRKEVISPNLPEATLFLLLFAADVDTATDKLGLESGELTEQEESYILGLCNQWGFYEGFSSQSELEAAISKYQRLKSLSLNQDDFIGQCVELLPPEPGMKDIIYYLCLDILFLKGQITPDSVEEDLMVKLERILKINPDVADFIFGLEIFKAAVAD